MKRRVDFVILLVFTFLGFWGRSQIYKDTIYVATSGIDSYVNGASSGSNYGNDSLLQVAWTGTRALRTLIDIDLSSIPKTAIVLKAELKLNAKTVTSMTSQTMVVERILDTWTEGGVKYDNQPKVTTAGRDTIPNAALTSTGWQTFNMPKVAQYVVNHPEINNGWRISLTSESGGAKGVVYYSSEYGTTSKRPYIIVEYELPILITATVRHCSYGLNNGTIDVTVDDGSGTYSSYAWYKYSGGTVTTVQSSGSGISTIDIDSLTDGLYLCTVTDNRGKIGYKYFLVGKYGTTTTVEFRNNSSSTNAALFNEDALITKTITPTLDSTREGGSDNISNAFRSSSSHTAALMKFNVDFDSIFDITQADLRLISAGHYKNSSPATTDSGYVSRVKQNWYEGFVTWNTRPSVTTIDRVTINETSPAGAVTRNDTVDLLDFVHVWQEYPDSNFGVNIRLKKYTQSADAYLRYHSTDNTTSSNRPGIVLTYSLPQQVITEYIDSLGRGNIMVTAPNGELPYTYLISYDTLPDFDSIWYSVKDSVAIDSINFYRGRTNSHRYIFDDLPNDHYFIGVYDNNGVLIFSDDVYITPSFEVFDSTDLEVDGDTLKVESGETEANATMFACLPEEEPGGFELQVVTLADGLLVGFDNVDDAFPENPIDYRYSLNIRTTGKVYAMLNDSILDSTVVVVGNTLKLYKDEFGVMHFYKQGEEFAKDTIPDSLYADLKVAVNLKGAASKALFKGLSKGVKKPKLKYTVQHTDCNDTQGSIIVSLPAGTLFSPSLVSYAIYDNDNDLMASGSTSTTVPLDPGIYKIYYTYTAGGYSLSWYEQFVIGYWIDWTNLVNMTENTTPYHFVHPTSLSTLATANSLNKGESIKDIWIRFSTEGSSTTFTLSSEMIQIKNASGVVPVKLVIVEPGGGIISKFVYVFDESGYEGEFIGDMNPIRIERTGGGVVSIYNFNTLEYTFSSTATGNLFVDISEYKKVQIKDAIASFCYPLNPYVAKTKPYMDGSYFITNDNQLNFQYTGEYNQSNLIYELTDENGNIISTSNYDLDVTGGSGVLQKNADNRYTLDLQSLAGGFYLLTITNEKGEKHYLQIKN